MTNTITPKAVSALDFAKLDGLIAVVIQDASTARVLMVGFMNQEAISKTIETGFVVFYSRSRDTLWLKGESSGHRLAVRGINTDCDRDALLILVDPLGPGVCHEGYESCFVRQLQNDEWVVTEAQTFQPSDVYGETQ
ncbi:MAG: phosphoribosyl-AMP cyclohydrolase [Actinomycetota bacterium]